MWYCRAALLISTPCCMSTVSCCCMMHQCISHMLAAPCLCVSRSQSAPNKISAHNTQNGKPLPNHSCDLSGWHTNKCAAGVLLQALAQKTNTCLHGSKSCGDRAAFTADNQQLLVWYSKFASLYMHSFGLAYIQLPGTLFVSTP